MHVFLVGMKNPWVVEKLCDIRTENWRERNMTIE